MFQQNSIICFVALLLLATKLVSADYGCFSSVDTSVKKAWEQYGTKEACSASCGDGYPYIAMKNGGDCFCLTELPGSSSQTSSSQCAVKCNGYGQDICGGTNAYTVFDNLSYSGGPVSTATTSQTSSKASSSSTGASASSSNTSPNTNSLSASTSTGASSSSTSQGITPGVTPSVTTTTFSDGSNSVQYKTVTTTSDTTSSSTSTSSSSSSSAANVNGSNNKSSTNIAPIVGGVVGGAAAVAIAFAIFFFIRRRNLKNEDDEEDFFKKGSTGSTGRGGISRAKSNKINSVFDMPMANPFEHPADDIAEKRASKMTNTGLTDPRLNPVMMGRRRLSEGSLADEADYSRKILGVANP
ncbi:hypothetical protein JCM33374_g4195 [Metschnikowia sp. JCM 33374]|nr:hypothetical protein JCM33374_g4195 [Metschnikowia sp. JCM 33374]